MKLNLPEITALIGSTERKESDILSTIIATVKKPKKNKNLYVVSMLFDLEKQLIKFTNPIPYNDELRYRFHYFGNNSAASAQSYLVRDVNSLHYLLTSVWNDLFLALKQNELKNSELVDIIDKMVTNELMTIGSKKGEGSVALEKITLNFEKNGYKFSIDKKKKLIIAKNDENEKKQFKYVEFIRSSLGDKNQNDNFLLVVPVVKYGYQEEIVLSNHPDYLELVKKLNHLGKKEGILNGVTADKPCYVCHNMKSNVSSEYSVAFSRSGINKIFTTTTINSARQINKNNYDDNYSMCNECYQNMRNGEKIINEKFQTKIAGERALIIPESLMNYFDYSALHAIKDSVDFAFQSKEASQWINDINAVAFFDETQYVLNIILYRTDGNSVTILDTISDVPLLRFERLMKALSTNSAIMREHVKLISLGSIYRMIPVKKSKTEQVDIGRVLSLYKVLLTGGKISLETLFDYCVEALDKGLKQLSKSKIDNYQNLGILNYQNGKEDFFIKRIVMSYLILFRTCQQMSVLENQLLNFQEKEETDMGEESNRSLNITETLTRMDQFIEKQGFNSKAKALFYLGALINRVAIAQYQKEHKTKPILKRINFQGMTEKEMVQLYADAVEKLRQYKKWNLYSDNLMAKFHQYYGVIKENDEFSEHANVFYLMSGYAYMVGNKAPDLSAQEQEASEVLSIDEDEAEIGE
jgi:CRISPR-associated protein Csh1